MWGVIALFFGDYFTRRFYVHWHSDKVPVSDPFGDY